jgi:hypothetical protein
LVVYGMGESYLAWYVDISTSGYQGSDHLLVSFACCNPQGGSPIL